MLQKYSVKLFKNRLGINHPDTIIAQSNLKLMVMQISKSEIKEINRTPTLYFLNKLKDLNYQNEQNTKTKEILNFERFFKTRRYMGSSTM